MTSISQTAEAETPIGSASPEAAKSNPQVGQIARVVSALSGSAMLISGLRRGAKPGGAGLAVGLLGSALLYRGLTGNHVRSQLREWSSAKLSKRPGVPSGTGMRISRSVAIQRPPEDLYAKWRDLANLPQIMRHLDEIEEIDEKRSRWTALGPFGQTVQWEAEIIGDKKPEEISWQSLPGGDLQTAGSVHFTPLRHNRGTALKVTLKYNPLAGKLGASIAKILGQGLEQKLEEDLRRFKSVMEAGEAPTTSGQSHGDGSRGRYLPLTSES